MFSVLPREYFYFLATSEIWQWDWIGGYSLRLVHWALARKMSRPKRDEYMWVEGMLVSFGTPPYHFRSLPLSLSQRIRWLLLCSIRLPPRLFLRKNKTLLNDLLNVCLSIMRIFSKVTSPIATKFGEDLGCETSSIQWIAGFGWEGIPVKAKRGCKLVVSEHSHVE